MGFFNVILKFNTILSFLSAISQIVARVVNRDSKLPTCEETTEILRHLEILIRKRVVRIKGVDEEKLIETLRVLNDNIVCSIGEAHRNIQLVGSIKNRTLSKPEPQKENEGES